jgi:hypothetical protein
MTKLPLSLVLGLAIGAVLPSPASAHGPLPSAAPTIAAQLLSDSAGDVNGFDRDWYDFDIVTEALLLFPDLVAAASDPNQNLTGFIPNDRAFQVLVFDLTRRWLRTEREVFDAVASLGADTVKTVLTYHIVPARISARDALGANGAQLPTLQGNTIRVQVLSRWFGFIRLIDQDGNDFDPWIIRSKFDFGGELANGYLHGISLVLRPADL